jgi:uncharacterized damage-inducible protein DinB
MNHQNYYTVMAAYNAWMNQNLYAICATIPDEQRKADLGAFFRSIHGTLNHLLYGDRAWIGRFTQQPVAGSIGQDLYADFDELWAQRQLTDQQLITWTHTLPSEWLQHPFTYTSQVDQVTRTLPAWLLVTHLFNHQTHHRGQLTTLLNQLGYDSGVTDLPWLPGLTSDSVESAAVE